MKLWVIWFPESVSHVAHRDHEVCLSPGYPRGLIHFLWFQDLDSLPELEEWWKEGLWAWDGKVGNSDRGPSGLCLPQSDWICTHLTRVPLFLLVSKPTCASRFLMTLNWMVAMPFTFIHWWAHSKCSVSILMLHPRSWWILLDTGGLCTGCVKNQGSMGSCWKHPLLYRSCKFTYFHCVYCILWRKKASALKVHGFSAYSLIFQQVPVAALYFEPMFWCTCFTLFK